MHNISLQHLPFFSITKYKTITWIESVIRTLVLISTYQNSAIEIVYKDETVSQYEPGPLQNYNHKIAVSKHAQNNRIRTFEVTIFFFLNNKPLSRICVCVSVSAQCMT